MLDLQVVSFRPVYTITPALLMAVEQIAALRERILAAAVQVPWIPGLQKDSRVRNAHSSTAIEGNPLTLEQVRAIEEGREIPATAQRPRREVVNYFAQTAGSGRWHNRELRMRFVTASETAEEQQRSSPRTRQA